MRRHRSRVLAALVALACGIAVLAVAPSSQAAPARLTNLSHLDFLGTEVSPPAQAGHTTYRLGSEPRIGTLWTYADRNADGSFRKVGGGAYHPETDTYDQGAFNADDVARAAVVYLRDWRQTGSPTSRQHAYQLLRGLTYMQTTSGPYAGNVVLWMQPDGTLNRSAKPVELPDPSDSDASYWLARTVWALGEAYPAFAKADPAFGAFLKDRLDLAIGAIDRQVLDAYGTYQQVDGRRTPRWLVADGADASAEAVLGLAPYVRATGDATARRVMSQLSDGIAQLSAGDARQWPHGGVLPWALSRSDWHAWSSQMPAALALAGDVLGDRDLTRVAQRDSSTFDPWMLTSGGPDNGRLPTRVDATQIAYGIDSRVQSLLATGGPAAEDLAGLTASWFFGANAAGTPGYDPATGVTVDGVAADGTVNRNGGAESTIHGLLTMLALDAHPRAARVARIASVTDRVVPTTLQAEDATLAGGATAVTPSSTWTGESQYGGTGYASVPAGGSVTFPLGAHPASLVESVVDLQPGSRSVTTYTAGRRLGRVDAGAVGSQGTSPAPGALLPTTLQGTLPAGERTLRVTATGAGETRLDAVVLQPLVTRLVQGGQGGGTALVRNAATSTQHTRVAVPGTGRATVSSYDGLGRLLSRSTTTASTVDLRVPGSGFVLVTR